MRPELGTQPFLHTDKTDLSGRPASRRSGQARQTRSRARPAGRLPEPPSGTPVRGRPGPFRSSQASRPAAMEHEDPAEAFLGPRARRLRAVELLQLAAGSGLAAYAVWALLLQPGFRGVPLRLQVPYVGASARQVEHVLLLLRGRPGKTVDLGSGDGRIVLAAHRCGLRPAVGYELNPWLLGLARLHAWRAGCAGRVRYYRQDLWKVSLKDCYNVSVFLAPSVLPLLEDKLWAELPPGARVVAGRFPLPTWQPVAVAGEGQDCVWAYDVPGAGFAVSSSGVPSEATPGLGSPPVPGTPTVQAGWTQ
ncbi:adenine nucleotide translocase lysine N-methyltransferase-like isoform X2 [Dipodomys merriami]|uniref:adenine nucleotide translocase lysine N-methyltransferase-like isoform X2 n=1 Tax=Dipodomys merriami TaxID=94247 RepID=UPI00385603FF